MNYLSRDGYFSLKKEISLIAKGVVHQTTKTPSELKILLISMERSGSSWFGAHMSIEHMKIYGFLPLWNHECDRRYAVFKEVYTDDDILEIETPKGWTSVYDVDPRETLDKDFDKIILLEKPLEAIKNDICKYNHPAKWKQEQDTGKEDEFLGRLRKKIEQYWNQMFIHDIDDPKLYHIKLDELNNFTEWEWMKFCNWLGFPERSQAHPFAVNRNWQVFSDVLPTGYPLCARLRQIQEMHPTVLAEELLQEEIFFTKMKETPHITERKDYPFIHKVNPYVRMSYEKLPLEPRSFRIDIGTGEIKDVIKDDVKRVK